MTASPTSCAISTSLADYATGSPVEVIEGEEDMTFQCKTVGVRPYATFSWMLQDQKMTADRQDNVPNQADKQLSDCTSNLTIPGLTYGANRDDRLSCSAHVAPDTGDVATTHVVFDIKGKS